MTYTLGIRENLRPLPFPVSFRGNRAPSASIGGTSSGVRGSAGGAS
jgi:hypothetical protein